jgi:serine/threonine protein kinase/tetratricopeptide (TPR) repeat protein
MQHYSQDTGSQEFAGRLPGADMREPGAGDDPLARAACELAREMREAWCRGEQAPAEEFLQRRPELWQQPTYAMEVIYEEVLLREEQGQQDAWAALARRFPQWHDHLQALQECHEVLEPAPAAAQFPAVGDSVGEYRLLAELGRGALGRVFLASQPALANRSVVLKVTPRSGREHLSLARLQHTHIVPLYAARDDAGRRLRFLCMPYFGGATLSDVLRILAKVPACQRTGRHLIEAVDELQAARPVPASAPSGPRQVLSRMTYPQAIASIAARCAEALDYAHERGLLHLDLKPSNLLIAADGQPMLLDFHLAHEPILPGHPLPDRLGGTPAYMAPEQRAAAEAVENDHPIEEPVDAGADIYSLGALLYEALGGQAPYRPDVSPALHHVNAEVSLGLSDIISHCLAARPGDRYSNAAVLASDLRSHVMNRPLHGVRNRSLTERWRKWRRRQPSALRLAAMLVVALGATLALALGAWLRLSERVDEARLALVEGGRQRQEQHYDDAEATLRHGLALIENLPHNHDLQEQLRGQLEGVSADHRNADRHHLLASLHAQAEQMRVLFGMEIPPSPRLDALLKRCRELWDKRTVIRASLDADRAAEAAVDLTELAVLWTDLRVRSATGTGSRAAAEEALHVLAEAREFFGDSAVIVYEQARYCKALGLPAPASPARPLPARAAWEHNAMGRCYLRAGDLHAAEEELKKALVLQPHSCWSNYYCGLCAYGLEQYAEAALAFSVCIGAAPERAGLYYNRALAFSAQGRDDLALLDYDRALRLEPTLAAAALNRGMLRFRVQRYAEARGDLHQALQLGAMPATVHYDMALIDLAEKKRDAALAHVRQALEYAPSHAEARQLLQELELPKSR